MFVYQFPTTDLQIQYGFHNSFFIMTISTSICWKSSYFSIFYCNYCIM